MLGPIEKDENKNVTDLTRKELFAFIPIVIFVVWIGVHPNTFLSKSEASVKKIVDNFQTYKKRLGAIEELQSKMADKKPD